MEREPGPLLLFLKSLLGRCGKREKEEEEEEEEENEESKFCHENQWIFLHPDLKVVFATASLVPPSIRQCRITLESSYEKAGRIWQFANMQEKKSCWNL